LENAGEKFVEAFDRKDLEPRPADGWQEPGKLRSHQRSGKIVLETRWDQTQGNGHIHGAGVLRRIALPRRSDFIRESGSTTGEIRASRPPLLLGPAAIVVLEKVRGQHLLRAQRRFIATVTFRQRVAPRPWP